MDEAELLFNLVYLLVCMIIIYPPEEFQRMGLTIEQLCAHWLGEEQFNFVLYHQKRTSLNLYIHSCLPAIYFIIYRYQFTGKESELDPDFPMPQEVVAFKSFTWKMINRFCLLAVIAAPVLILSWHQENWNNHPIAQTLSHFSNVPNSITNLISEINNEFRRPNIYKKRLNSISTVIVTENWIIKTSLYNVHFAHQSVASLSVTKSDTYNISHNSRDTLQMITIMVKTNRTGVADFHIRINGLDFRNLEDHVRRPILIPSNVRFHRNVIDRFVDVFKEQIRLNPTYRTDRMAENCFACMVAAPNVKINKQCQDIDHVGRPLTNDLCCTNCNCQPMWCVECLARWFAVRLNEHARDIWLAQKGTCPMCRAKFCVLDVSYIEDPATAVLRNVTNDHDT